MSDSKINVKPSTKKSEENSQEMSRYFHGLYVPREVWLIKELSLLEKCLWSEIHSLYDEEKGGCYASNEYLMKFTGTKERQLRGLLSNLKKHGFLEEVSFDGRQRIMKAILPTKTQTIENKEDEKIAGQTGKKLPVSAAKNCPPPPYILDKSLENNNNPYTPLPDPDKQAAIAAVDSLITDEIRDLAKKVVNLLAAHSEIYTPAPITPLAKQFALLMKDGKIKPKQILDTINWTANDPFWCSILYKTPNMKDFCNKFLELYQRTKVKKPEPNKVDRRTLNQDGTPVEVKELF